MKTKNSFMMRKVVDMYVVMPTGDSVVKFDGLISLNESGAMLWRLLERGGNEEELVEALTSEYNVSKEQARMDVKEFLDTIRSVGCLED